MYRLSGGNGLLKLSLESCQFNIICKEPAVLEVIGVSTWPFCKIYLDLSCGRAISQILAGGNPVPVTASHRPSLEPCR